jgi:2-(1,2-epoxy-1,2-dihydrophenyl)acetyl-CoA isomerase
MTETVRYEQHDKVAIVALNRPESLNGFTTALCTGLQEALERASQDGGIRVVVLTGEGRAFSAGADLKSGFEGSRTTQGKLNFEYRPVLACIAQMQKPVLAAVPGFAAGIGLSFVLQSDLVMMADDAFLLSPFTTIGLLPDGGANWLLVRQLGYHRAYQLAIESERIPAARCVELGLANKVVPSAQLRDAALEWASALAERAPLSLAASKKAMRHAAQSDWASSFELEAELQEQLRNSTDAAEGVAAFLQKRAPKFCGK